MRLPHTNVNIPLGLLVSTLANRVPRTATMRILQGPARNLRWIAGAGQLNFWLGTYERGKVQEFSKWLNPSSVVYDVGANAGYYSLVAARRSAEGLRLRTVSRECFFSERAHSQK
jgi:hypothetical protein